MSLRAQNYILCFLAILILSLDQASKYFVRTTGLQLQGSYYSLERIENFGIIFGLLADAHPFVRVIFFSLIFILIMMSYLIMDYLFLDNQGLFKLRLGLTMFFSGIAGNALERILAGRVTDFLQIYFWDLKSHYVNLADVFQIIGLIVSIFYLFRLQNLVWMPQNTRKSYIINPEFQFKVARFFIFLTLIPSFSVGVLAFFFLKIYLGNGAVDIFLSFIVTWMTLMFIICMLVFMLGIYLSHRVAGPLYALERFVLNINETNPDANKFRMRKKDYFHNLEALAKRILELMGEQHK